MFPFVPLLALAGILGGSITLFWYDCLNDEEKKRADRVAGQYALELFGKSLDQLTSSEAKLVHNFTQRHFA